MFNQYRMEKNEDSNYGSLNARPYRSVTPHISMENKLTGSQEPKQKSKENSFISKKSSMDNNKRVQALTPMYEIRHQSISHL